MAKSVKIILIAFSVLICIACIAFSLFFYSQNQRLSNNLHELKANLEDAQKDRENLKTRLEDSENKREALKKENDAYVDKLKDNTRLLEQVSRQKSDLEKDLASAKDELKKSIEEKDRLQKELEEERSNLSQLKEEKNAALKLREQEDEKGVQNDRAQDDALDYVAEKANLKALKPKDFVSVFSGNEEFLQNCKNPLCAKIILNNSGIKYARQEQWEKAEEAFKKILSQDPDYKPAKLNLGLVYDKTRTKKEAVNYWLTVLK